MTSRGKQKYAEIKQQLFAILWLSIAVVALLAIADPAIAAPREPSFEPQPDGELHKTGGGPRDVISADFDNDGDSDFATANFFNNGDDDVTVYLGDGNGGFTLAGNFDAFAGVTALASDFLDNDSCLDLVVADQGPPARFAVLFGNCDGTFDAPVQYDSNGSSGEDVALGDFDEDGDVDIALAQGSSNSVAIFINQGINTGTFQLAFTHLSGGTDVRSLAVADFDEDGDVDLAVANAGSDNVTILRGGNGASFSATTTVPVGDGPVNVISGDFDGDGNEDFATANNNSDNVSVALGNGDGTFAPAQNFGTEEGPFALAVADYNQDGTLDLAATNQFTRTGGGPDNDRGSVSVLSGNGDGTFAAQVVFDVGDGPVSIASSDFDEDEKPDLAVANFGAGDPDTVDTVSILLNTTTPQADLSITKSVPDPIIVGESADFTLTVKNEGPDDAENVVVTDDLDDSLTYNDAQSSPECELNTDTSDSNDVKCELASLAAGEEEVFTISVTPTQAKQVSNTATVENDLYDPDDSDNESTVTTTARPRQADLSIVKDAPTQAVVEENATFELTVKNEGPDDAENVVVTDDLDDSLTYNDAQSSPECELITSTTDPNDVRCSSASLAAEDQVEFTISVTPTQAKQVSNMATVTSETEDPDSGNNDSNTTQTTVRDPRADLSIDKDASFDPGPQPTVGQNITFTLEVKNEGGPEAAENVVITDDLPGNVAFVTASDGCTNDNGTVTCELGTLAVDRSVTKEIVVRVTQEGTINNTAKVESDTEDPNTINNQDEENLTATPAGSNCTITGTEGNEALRGTSGNDIICGLGGNDAIDGLGGDDVIFGGRGRDTIKGGGDRDNIFGEKGVDTISSRDGELFEYIDGGPGSDRCRTDGGDSRVSCP